MLSAFGQLLPIALAAAVSSVPITLTILILLSPKRSRVAIPFLIGWVAGMAVVVVLSSLGASALPIRSIRTSQKAIGIGEIIVGVGLLVVAVLSWRRAARATTAPRNRWLDSVERLGPATALGLAVVLNLRPKGLLLGAAAGLAVAGARLSGTDAVIAILSYLALASATVTVPIIATLVSPARMEPRLVLARDWLDRNGGHITVVVLLMVGVVILGDGLTRL
ncbi:MAG TPA: GAP family protein [Propionibacteriaceae bacterium]|nr:GAP family protein [Propionibacteriaceae bacterium]